MKMMHVLFEILLNSLFDRSTFSLFSKVEKKFAFCVDMKRSLGIETTNGIDNWSLGNERVIIVVVWESGSVHSAWERKEKERN